jgi:hypothetical protein
MNTTNNHDLKVKIAEILLANFSQSELNKMYEEFNLEDWITALDLAVPNDENDGSSYMYDYR